MKMKEKKGGFTLAEVLITLGIIGVVAALTIPTLMANWQKVQEVAGLKKAYAEVTEALRLMANDHGCPDDLRCTGIFATSDQNALGNEIKKYLKVAKDCGTKYNANEDESTKCFSDAVSNYYDGSHWRSDYNTENGSTYTLITTDGFSIALINGGYDCKWGDLFGIPNTPNTNSSQICGQLYIDVNGLKGPNNMGRDIFYLYITNGKGPALYPYGGSEFISNGWAWVDGAGAPKYCTEGSSESVYGGVCAARIMEQGWQMLY